MKLTRNANGYRPRLTSKITQLGVITTFLGLFLCACAITDFNLMSSASAQDETLNQEALGRLDGLLQEQLDEGGLVGCTALVAHKGEVAYFKTFGYQDAAAETPMAEDTIFRIYSMSKPITSVAVMILVEEGKIDLDEPLSTYLPPFADMKVLIETDPEPEVPFEEVDVEREITTRDLLRHTSGLTYGFFGSTEVDQRYLRAGVLMRDADLESFVETLSGIPLLYQPGTRFNYSVSTDVLGRLVEVVSEQRFGEFLEERIFKPLEMNDTFFTVPEEKRDRFAEMYTRQDDGQLVPSGARRSRGFLTEGGLESGGGGLCSTTTDYLRFAQMLLDGGEGNGVRILQEETIAEMTKNQLGEITGRRSGFQFGLGFSIDQQGRYGWGGAAGTRFWVDPENDVVGIFMVQINPYQGENYEAMMKRVVERALR